ncbi:MAG: bifunctional oligoribonuclease/PAP phosphatase NrnA [Candidatus Adiutrix intracellularis]|jgi:phosphoesterase RecJ-like protein|nr:bifunctional oligoribonuclease/PAP phosphatase NrnA [Candidatus Adiutrix intracellularis]
MTDIVPDWRPAALELLNRSRKILILTHHNPDGDALGSSAALARTLIGQGRQADIALIGAWAERLNFLLTGLFLVELPDNLAVYDLLLLLDCHSFDRLGPAAKKLAVMKNRPPVLVVDHHPLDEAETFKAVWLHQTSASSTGELTWALIKAWGVIPPLLAVEALLVAITMDTGFFTQNNTTATSLRAVADLVDLGGSLDQVNRQLKNDLPLRRFKLMGLVLNTLTLYCGGRLAVMIVTPAFLEQTGAVITDTEELAEMGRQVVGVILSALVKDVGQGFGTIRVSLRSRESLDASALARVFGGGGHRQAAAYDDPHAGTAGVAVDNLLRWAEIFLND